MQIFIGLKACIMLTGFDVSTLGLNCLLFFLHFHAPKLMWNRSQFFTKTPNISHSSWLLSGQVEITPESRGDSAHSTPCSERVWLEPSTWLGSDKSGHKVALLPFLNCLQGQRPDLHVNSATASLFGIPETVQNNKNRPNEKIKSAPRCIQNNTHSQMLTAPWPKIFPEYCMYKAAWLEKNQLGF